MYSSKTIKVILAALIVLPLCKQVIASDWVMELSNSWTNSYVTEGSNNDRSSSFWTLNEVLVEKNDFVMGAFYAQSLNSAYNEVQLFTGYQWAFESVQFHAGFAHVIYPALDADKSWELYMGLEYALNPHLLVTTEAFYDFDDVGGGVAEIGLAFPFPGIELIPALGITPYTFIGIDYGYESDGRKLRRNHWQFGVEFEYEFADSVSALLGIHRTVRLKNMRELDEPTSFWVEAGISASF